MSRRKSIEVEGLNHGGMPIPAASLVDNILISGGINGTDAATGKMPESTEEQCANLFKNVKLIVEAANGTTDTIIKMTFFVKDRSSREAINKEWLTMFPDAHSRPARHTLVYDLASPMLIQAEIYAVI
ncbi:MAG: enamine deaminase RidA [Chloroflexi bacterium]|jgi:2-iminobutanoate/2-iminopropanoate deaminase|nr:enamine deaminase RidA [Chloroflexota bacterium]